MLRGYAGYSFKIGVYLAGQEIPSFCGTRRFITIFVLFYLTLNHIHSVSLRALRY
jgi:hypothetical protein